MKRLIPIVLLLMGILSVLGCSEKPAADTVVKDTTPISAFEYKVENNNVIITKYIGKDVHIIIPEKIDDKNVTTIDALAFYQSKIITVQLPDTVTTIGKSAFSQCRELKSIRLSTNLNTIDENAFISCEMLSDVILPDTLTKLGSGAFKNCKWLHYIYIPKGVKSIEPSTFANSMLKTIDLSNTLESVDKEAFKNTNLKEITLPESLKSISADAFSGCPNLQKVKFEGDAPGNFTPAQSKPSFTVYYHKKAKGFTSPTWNGYKTEKW